MLILMETYLALVIFQRGSGPPVEALDPPTYKTYHTRPRVYKTFFVLNSAENKMYPAHKVKML